MKTLEKSSEKLRPVKVDLRSDTLTKPSKEMRSSMAEAEVGDDVYGEDPTVKKLEKTMADLCGMEAGLFVPSGTMGNLISVMIHCPERGGEIILGDLSHIHYYEQGGIAQIGGIHSRTVKNLADGTFDLKEVEEKIRAENIHYPVSRLLVIENTQNKCGGTALPLSWIREASDLCKDRGMSLHCDAARIFNAAKYLRVSVKDLLSPWCDSACICLSKSLGAPIGSVVVGKLDFINRARRLRKALGGGMRQAGIIAQAGLFALEHHVPLLASDHDKALRLATAINDINSPLFQCQSCHTNIVLVNILEDSFVMAEDVVNRLEKFSFDEIQDMNGEAIVVKSLVFGKKVVRFTFHLDISEFLFDSALTKIIFVLKKFVSDASIKSAHFPEELTMINDEL